MKYHRSPVTGKFEPCGATKKPCKYGESAIHTTEETARNFAEALSIPQSPSPFISDFVFEPRVLPEMDIVFARHGTYVKTTVEENSRLISDAYTFLDSKLESDGFAWHLIEEIFRNRETRDGGSDHHMTLLSPKETRALKKSGKTPEDIGVGVTVDDAIALGVGSVRDEKEGTESFYVIVESASVQEMRARLGLKPHNLHITLGFIGSDTHDQSKDFSTRML